MNRRADAEERARRRDAILRKNLEDFRLPEPKRLLSGIRAYLLERRSDGHPGNQVESALKSKVSGDSTLINLGPTIDKGVVADHYLLQSGARLSFGITVRRDGSKSKLISYRIDFRNEAATTLPLVRFELVDRRGEQPLMEPLAHAHLGMEDLRLPTALVDPFEVLDIVFFVIDPAMCKQGNNENSR